MKLWIVIFFVLVSFPAFGNRLDSNVHIEIEKLVEYVKNSPCKFYRNGSWHDSNEAAEHITKKYQYVLKKGLVKSSEDFIKYAATKSSISGRTYKIKCENSEIIKCSDWLKKQLNKIRTEI